MTNILNFDKNEFKKKPIIFKKRKEYLDENEMVLSPRRNLTPKNSNIERKLLYRNEQSRVNLFNRNLNIINIIIK